MLLFMALTIGVCLADGKDEPLVVVEDGKYGYINHEGRIVIHPQFLWANDFWRGLGTVYVCGQYVSIDSSGALHPLRIAVEGQLEPRKNGEKFGFVDSSGQFKIEPEFDEALPFSESLAAVRVGEKWGFVDTAGRWVIRPQFKNAFYFREGIGVAESDSGYVLIDKSGAIIAQGLDFVDFISEGRVPARRAEKWGYLDLQGKIVISFIYDEARAFSGNFAAVKTQSKWGYIDRKGKIVVPTKFDEVGPFSSGLAPARAGSISGFIDKSGTFAFNLAFQYAPGFFTGDEQTELFTAPANVSRFWTDDGRFGYVNISGRVIWGPVVGSPDHVPLQGWSEEQKTQSCEGIPDSTRTVISKFPDR